MRELLRRICWLCAALLAGFAWPRLSLGDYPDYSPRPPVDSRPAAAQSQEPAVLRQTDSGERREVATQPLPLRQPTAREGGALVEPATGNEAAPERLVAHERAIPLVRPSTDGKSATRGETPPLLTGAASLGIVLGLFLLVAWAVRRGMPKNSALLPRDAFEVLGRAPLVGRHQVHLVRCGNKILLLNVSAASVEMLTEITDAAEIERLSEICEQTTSRKLPATLRHAFQQFAGARGNDYLTGGEVDDVDFRHSDTFDRHRAQEAHA